MSKETGMRIFMVIVLAAIALNFAGAAMTGEIYALNLNNRMNDAPFVQQITTADARGFWGTVIFEGLVATVFIWLLWREWAGLED